MFVSHIITFLATNYPNLVSAYKGFKALQYLINGEFKQFYNHIKELSIVEFLNSLKLLSTTTLRFLFEILILLLIAILKLIYFFFTNVFLYFIDVVIYNIIVKLFKKPEKRETSDEDDDVNIVIKPVKTSEIRVGNKKGKIYFHRNFYLNNWLQQNNYNLYPSYQDRMDLANILNCDQKHIYYWFQYKRKRFQII